MLKTESLARSSKIATRLDKPIDRPIQRSTLTTLGRRNNGQYVDIPGGSSSNRDIKNKEKQAVGRVNKHENGTIKAPVSLQSLQSQEPKGLQARINIFSGKVTGSTSARTNNANSAANPANNRTSNANTVANKSATANKTPKSGGREKAKGESILRFEDKSRGGKTVTFQDRAVRDSSKNQKLYQELDHMLSGRSNGSQGITQSSGGLTQRGTTNSDAQQPQGILSKSGQQQAGKNGLQQQQSKLQAQQFQPPNSNTSVKVYKKDNLPNLRIPGGSRKETIPSGPYNRQENVAVLTKTNLYPTISKETREKFASTERLNVQAVPPLRLHGSDNQTLHSRELKAQARLNNLDYIDRYKQDDYSNKVNSKPNLRRIVSVNPGAVKSQSVSVGIPVQQAGKVSGRQHIVADIPVYLPSLTPRTPKSQPEFPGKQRTPRTSQTQPPYPATARGLENSVPHSNQPPYTANTSYRGLENQPPYTANTSYREFDATVPESNQSSYTTNTSYRDFEGSVPRANNHQPVEAFEHRSNQPTYASQPYTAFTNRAPEATAQQANHQPTPRDRLGGTAGNKQPQVNNDDEFAGSVRTRSKWTESTSLPVFSSSDQVTSDNNYYSDEKTSSDDYQVYQARQARNVVKQVEDRQPETQRDRENNRELRDRNQDNKANQNAGRSTTTRQTSNSEVTTQREDSWILQQLELRSPNTNTMSMYRSQSGDRRSRDNYSSENTRSQGGYSRPDDDFYRNTNDRPYRLSADMRDRERFTANEHAERLYRPTSRDRVHTVEGARYRPTSQDRAGQHTQPVDMARHNRDQQGYDPRYPAAAGGANDRRMAGDSWAIDDRIREQSRENERRYVVDRREVDRREPSRERADLVRVNRSAERRRFHSLDTDAREMWSGDARRRAFVSSRDEDRSRGFERVDKDDQGLAARRNTSREGRGRYEYRNRESRHRDRSFETDIRDLKYEPSSERINRSRGRERSNNQRNDNGGIYKGGPPAKREAFSQQSSTVTSNNQSITSKESVDSKVQYVLKSNKSSTSRSDMKKNEHETLPVAVTELSKEMNARSKMASERVGSERPNKASPPEQSRQSPIGSELVTGGRNNSYDGDKTPVNEPKKAFHEHETINPNETTTKDSTSNPPVPKPRQGFQNNESATAETSTSKDGAKATSGSVNADQEKSKAEYVATDKKNFLSNPENKHVIAEDRRSPWRRDDDTARSGSANSRSPSLKEEAPGHLVGDEQPVSQVDVQTSKAVKEPDSVEHIMERIREKTLEKFREKLGENDQILDSTRSSSTIREGHDNLWDTERSTFRDNKDSVVDSDRTTFRESNKDSVMVLMDTDRTTFRDNKDSVFMDSDRTTFRDNNNSMWDTQRSTYRDDDKNTTAFNTHRSEKDMTAFNTLRSEKTENAHDSNEEDEESDDDDVNLDNIESEMDPKELYYCYLMTESGEKIGPLKLDINDMQIGLPNAEKLKTLQEEEAAELASKEGMRNRQTGSHGLNEFSSRSHSMLMLTIDSDMQDPDDENLYITKRGKLTFVDLAGSEKVKDSNSTADTLVESNSINKSLLVLGNCISSLGDQKRRQGHIPYRDSKLTKLLADSLGGNGVTLMICCVTPSSHHASETMNTLRYASRAKKIRTKPVVKMDPREKLILSLKREIKVLRNENHYLRQQTGIDIPPPSMPAITNNRHNNTNHVTKWSRNDQNNHRGRGELEFPAKPKGHLQKENDQNFVKMMKERNGKADVNNTNANPAPDKLRQEGGNNADESGLYEMLQEYMVENESLRTENAEMQVNKDKVRQDQQLLYRDNERLLKRVDELERRMNANSTSWQSMPRQGSHPSRDHSPRGSPQYTRAGGSGGKNQPRLPPPNDLPLRDPGALRDPVYPGSPPQGYQSPPTNSKGKQPPAQARAQPLKPPHRLADTIPPQSRPEQNGMYMNGHHPGHPGAHAGVHHPGSQPGPHHPAHHPGQYPQGHPNGTGQFRQAPVGSPNKPDIRMDSRRSSQSSSSDAIRDMNEKLKQELMHLDGEIHHHHQSINTRPHPGYNMR